MRTPLIVLAAVLACAGAAGAQTLYVDLVPSSSAVSCGETFELTVKIMVEGAPNGNGAAGCQFDIFTACDNGCIAPVTYTSPPPLTDRVVTEWGPKLAGYSTILPYKRDPDGDGDFDAQGASFYRIDPNPPYDIGAGTFDTVLTETWSCAPSPTCPCTCTFDAAMIGAQYWTSDPDEPRLDFQTVQLVNTEDDTVLCGLVPGDADQDGDVDIEDLSLLASNWDTCGKTWSDGDFTNDGCVDIEDLSLLASNWGFGTAGQAAAAPAAVPEPTTLGLLATVAAPLLRRRR